MLNNHVYNLMQQLVEENKSIWHIKQFYLGDIGECDECSKFWNDLIKDKEQHVEELTAMVKKPTNVKAIAQAISLIMKKYNEITKSKKYANVYNESPL